MASAMDNESIQTAKFYIKIVVAVAVVIVMAVAFAGAVARNDDTSFTVVQPVVGSSEMSVVDKGGYYFRGFSHTWSWNKYYDFVYSEKIEKESPTDESVGVTFQDGGRAKISAYVRVKLPSEDKKRIELNRMFAGNSANLRDAVLSHMTNALKQTAPIMTCTENQMSRKAEYRQLVERQMQDGLYVTRKAIRISKDETDDTGKPISVEYTEIIIDEKTGKPLVDKTSPFAEYGLEITQFSITGTTYDPKTEELFAAKKEAKLNAERSKADREKEVQERLMIEERGKRQKADIEATSNVEKAAAVIKATKEKEMAEIAAQQKVAVEQQAKLEAQTRLSKELEIMEMEKKIAETKANKELAVAKLEKEAAEQTSSKIKMLAEAEQQKIKLGGAITEERRVLAEIARDRDIGVARELANIRTPTFVSGQGGPGGANLTDTLVNLKLMTSLGILDHDQAAGQKPEKTAPAPAPVAAPAAKN